ncbi:MAG: hypothetical protein JW915_24715 [Chitinispirillaceae bacterium]|nr:hypothetical protein [Chitinispirillaceae bacterium]
MNSFNIKHKCIFLLLLTIYTYAERVYTVDRVIIPEYHFTLKNTVYTKVSSESQIFDNQWKNKQKFSFSYNDDGNQKGYSVVYWSNSSNSWTDSLYCMFSYNSSKQVIAYHVSPVNDDTVNSVIYKEYYSYNNNMNKFEKMNTFSPNSTDSLVLSSEEVYIYSQNSELDSVITINYDEDENYIWSTVSEKVHYVSDTMYSISEKTSYRTGPDSPPTTYDIEHQYLFSTDGKKLMQGKCLIPGLITERTLYSYREEDGLPEMDLSQNIDSFSDTTYKDTSRITYSYSFQDQSVIKIATTEILNSGNWVPDSRRVDTYFSEAVSTRKNSQQTTSRQYKINVYLTSSSRPALFISSSDRVISIELYSINGALLLKENSIQPGKEIQLDVSTNRVANFCGPMIAKIRLENGSSLVQRFFQVR